MKSSKAKPIFNNVNNNESKRQSDIQSDLETTRNSLVSSLIFIHPRHTDSVKIDNTHIIETQHNIAASEILDIPCLTLNSVRTRSASVPTLPSQIIKEEQIHYLITPLQNENQYKVGGEVERMVIGVAKDSIARKSLSDEDRVLAYLSLKSARNSRALGEAKEATSHYLNTLNILNNNNNLTLESNNNNNGLLSLVSVESATVDNNIQSNIKAHTTSEIIEQMQEEAENSQQQNFFKKLFVCCIYSSCCKN